MQTYNVRTWGCQMNEADSQRLESELEKLGLRHDDDADGADVIVLNTCVVRQSAEDRVYGRLGQLKSLKEQHPDKVIGLMGCLVGIRDPLPLRNRTEYIPAARPRGRQTSSRAPAGCPSSSRSESTRRPWTS